MTISLRSLWISFSGIPSGIRIEALGKGVTCDLDLCTQSPVLRLQALRKPHMRTCVRGRSREQFGAFRASFEKWRPWLAWAYATSLSHVSLEDALQLTLLAIKKDAHRFDAMAKRCIVRLIEERSVTFHEVEWAIQRLRDETEGLDGRTGLLICWSRNLRALEVDSIRLPGTDLVKVRDETPFVVASGPMDLEFAVLADGVTSRQDGKLDIYGAGWDTINAPSVPTRHPRLTLVVRLLITRKEAERPHRLDVALQTTDGSEIARARGDVEASDPADRDKNAAVGNTALVLAMNFDNLIFPEFGTYQLALTWDGDDLRPPIQLSVKQTPDS